MFNFDDTLCDTSFVVSFLLQVINSDITSGRTKPPALGPNPVGPQIKRIDIELVYKDVLSKSAHISWRFFSTEEKQFIDGVQIRYITH